MVTDSSRTTWSAGSAGPSSPPRPHSAWSGTGSGSHAPTYLSRRARAEPSTSRQMRPVTVVSQAPGERTSSRRPCGSAYQRA